MMTLHKLHAGDGYTYLTRQVAAGDEGRSPGQQLTDYYTASGNPPGRWVGRSRSTSRCRHARNGSRPGWRSGSARTGTRPSPVVRSKIEAQEARKERRAVAGYDLVFTPVKSASLLWALGSARTRQAVEDAHHEAVADTLAWLEQETAFARVGDAGEQQIETRGFLAAAFDHRDSRAGDPDLHTHLAISNKVRARDDHPDGRARWLSLDARVIHAAAVAASERYNTRFEDAADPTPRRPVRRTGRLGPRRQARRSARSPASPTCCSSTSPNDAPPSRTATAPSPPTTDTPTATNHPARPSSSSPSRPPWRPATPRRDPQSLADKLTAWRDEAATVLGRHGLARLEADALGRRSTPTASRRLALDAARPRCGLDGVGGEGDLDPLEPPGRDRTPAPPPPLRLPRGPASRHRPRAATCPPSRRRGPAHRRRTRTPAAARWPAPVAVARRSNGESVLHEHGTTRYTTQDLLDAEQRLLSYAAQPTNLGLRPDSAARAHDVLRAAARRHPRPRATSARARLHHRSLPAPVGCAGFRGAA